MFRSPLTIELQSVATKEISDMNPNADQPTLDSSPESASDSVSLPETEPALAEAELLEDLLVEEISIDGMCGVY